ncbi:MAG: MerR family transcriptional regulator [Alphaproteobacteria bacterium]|nr:MerR family transcriptional regulator [Alphaproteobacteria bacterium]
MHEDRPTWRIGELAEAAGVTVRTLHHYEQLGLLTPARSEGGHRVYGAEDVQRLYRIRALAELGLHLSEVGRVLDAGGGGLPEVLLAHLERVDEELERLRGLRARLQQVQAVGDAGTLLDTLEAMARLNRHVERRPARPGALRTDWQGLGEALRARLQAGLPPEAPEVRALAQQARAGLYRFAGDDPDVLEALAVVRQSAPPSGLAGWDPPLFRYLDAALAALEDS